MTPMQRGLTVMLVNLEKGRTELEKKVGHAFTKEEGEFFMRQFAHHLRSTAPLFIGVLISGYFAYETWQQTRSAEKVAFTLASDLYQNVTTPPLLVSVGLMILT